MDRRFTRAWDRIEACRTAGEPLQSVLQRTSTRELIAALAGIGEQDPVAANVLATELLNRQARAPFLGAFLVCVGMVCAIFLVDAILTGSPLFVLTDSSARGYVLAVLSSATGTLALLMYLSWRGLVRWPSALAARVRARRGGRRDTF